jgi:peptide/nickel transport system permease protein
MNRITPASTLLGAAIALLVFSSACSDFLSSNPPQIQNLERFFAPPTRAHFYDQQGVFHWRPFVYGCRLSDPIEIAYEEDTQAIHPLYFFIQGYGYRFLGLFPSRVHLVGTRTDKAFYPWGTDELGRDVLARVLAGAQTSLVVVIFGVLIYVVLGLAVGTLAGFSGGWLDSILMRFSEFVLALPALYVILALRAMLPPKLPLWQALLLTTGTIAAVTWPPMARGIRGLIQQLRTVGYVEAARALGCSRRWILIHHMIPALLPYTLQQTLVAAPLFLLGEVILSFLDVGISSSGISWGTMLRNLRDARILTDFWWNLSPLGFVFLSLLCLNIASTRTQRQVQTRTVL